MKKAGIIIAAIITVICMCGGCGIEKLDTTEKKIVGYTVVAPKEIPEDFAKQIEETQDIDFKLKYDDNEYL